MTCKYTHFNYEREPVHGVGFVTFTDRSVLTEEAIGEIQWELFELIRSTTFDTFMLDFSRIIHLSSATLSVFEHFARLAAELGKTLMGCGLRGQPLTVFNLTRTAAIPMVGDEEAQQRFGRRIA